jgi:hypothetical protein
VLLEFILEFFDFVPELAIKYLIVKPVLGLVNIFNNPDELMDELFIKPYSRRRSPFEQDETYLMKKLDQRA